MKFLFSVLVGVLALLGIALAVTSMFPRPREYSGTPKTVFDQLSKKLLTGLEFHSCRPTEMFNGKRPEFCVRFPAKPVGDLIEVQGVEQQVSRNAQALGLLERGWDRDAIPNNLLRYRLKGHDEQVLNLFFSPILARDDLTERLAIYGDAVK